MESQDFGEEKKTSPVLLNKIVCVSELSLFYFSGIENTSNISSVHISNQVL